MGLRMKLRKFRVLIAEIPCEWKFATKFASDFLRMRWLGALRAGHVKKVSLLTEIVSNTALGSENAFGTFHAPALVVLRQFCDKLPHGTASGGTS